VLADTWRERLKGWRHLTKLDPDRPLDGRRREGVLRSGTDALIIGGTQGITMPGVRALLERVSGCGLPVAVEVSSPAALVLGADLYLVPFVLNAGDPYWLVGAHQLALRDLGDWRSEFWQAVVPEAYLVLNPDSAVARLTRAIAPLGAEEAEAYGRCAEGLFGAPVVYLEYSGKYGDPRLVARVGQALGRSRLFYGGGIDGPERAAEMAGLVDTVVVGNLAHEGEPRLLAETVAAVRSTAGRSTRCPMS